MVLEEESKWKLVGEHLKKAFNEKEKVTGKVLKEIKGGYIVEVFSHQTFLPKSLSEAKRR